MKKISVLMLLSIFLLTGCGENRLVCTLEQESTNFEFESKYTFTFHGEKVKNITMKSTGTLLGDYNNETSIAEYLGTAESASEKYNKIEGMEAKVSSNKNKVTLTVEVIAASLSDENKETYGTNLSKEELKKELGEIGYTCK